MKSCLMLNLSKIPPHNARYERIYAPACTALECRYRRSFSDADRAAWVAQVKLMHALFQQKETLYWTTCIASNAGNQKMQWRSLSNILRRDKDASTPIPQLTAEKLSQFFIDKIDAVCTDTESSEPSTFATYTGKQFASFQEYMAEDIRKLLLQSPPKTCSLDPLPTNVLLESVDILLLPYICAMCNASLREGSLPATQKMAIITPVVK